MAHMRQELDYAFIKEKGLEYIQQLAGKKWTDYGEHDPGVTILEVLAFAIVDLAYRIDFPVEDIFAPNPDIPDQQDEEQFFSAEDILPCSPLTEWDFLKVILDVPGIKNANITISNGPNEIRGGYKVFLELEDSIRSHNTSRSEVIEQVKRSLYSQRNLCEDFFDIQLMKPLTVRLQASFEINRYLDHEDGERIVAQMLLNIQEFLSPSIRFYNISQLLEKGRSIDQIFTGPLLTQGFIDEEDLASLKKRNSIYIADLIKTATSDEAINRALSFEFFVEDQKFSSNDIILPLYIDKSLVFDIVNSNISLLYNEVPLVVDGEKVSFLIEEIQSRGALNKSYLQEEELFVVDGEYRDIHRYRSIQNDFPLLYNVGLEGCAPSESPDNHAKAKQLQAFLLFFDQIFANYFGQLSNIRNIMAFYRQNWENPDSRMPSDVPRMESLIKDVTGDEQADGDVEFVTQRKYLDLKTHVSLAADELFESKVLRDYQLYVNKVFDNDLKLLQRQSRILNHLLAYFSERFLTNSLYIHARDEKMQLRRLNDKKSYFLRNYALLSRTRNLGVDMLNQYRSDSTVSGFEHYLAMRLGIDNLKHKWLHELFKTNVFIQRKSKQSDLDIFLEKDIYKEYPNIFIFSGPYKNIHALAISYGIYEDYYRIVKQETDHYKVLLYVDKAKEQAIELLTEEPMTGLDQAERMVEDIMSFFFDFNEASEGFHLIEHIFLRTSNQLEDGAEDPYSFIMTIVFPTWPSRFQQSTFKNFVEELILLECPAHIFVNVLWLDYHDMEEFELAYQTWLDLRNAPEPVQGDIDTAANDLMALIQKHANSDAKSSDNNRRHINHPIRP